MNHVYMQMHSGIIYGLKGKNGSGKSMLMRCICGLIFPTSGEIRINQKILGKEISFPKSIGVLLESPAFLSEYTGYKNLENLATLQGKINKEEIWKVLDLVGLDPDDKRKYRKYSLKGKRKWRVWLVISLIIVGMMGRIIWLNSQYPNPVVMLKSKNVAWDFGGYRFSLRQLSMLDGSEYSKISGETSYLVWGDGTPYPADRQRIIVAAIQVEKLDGKETVFDLSQLALENQAWNNHMDQVLFKALNPKLKGMAVDLKEKEVLEIKCPFMAVDTQFIQKQWEELAVEEFGMVLAYYPQKVILGSVKN